MTIDDIQNKVNTAKLFYIQQMALKLAKIRVGSQVSFKTLLGVKRLITGLTFQITADVIDSDTNTMYNCLVQALGGFGAPYNIDPEVQIPGTTVLTVPVVSNFNESRIDFVTTDGSPVLNLANYNVNYKTLYGNSPSLALYTKQPDDANPGEFVWPQNLQTPAIITYQDDDSTKDILSIQWQFPFGTVGYINISGLGTISTGNTGGVGAKPIVLSYTQDDLVYNADIDQYQLPILLPGTAKPYYMTVNNETQAISYNEVSKRVSGFQNNDAAVIKINVI